MANRTISKNHTRPQFFHDQISAKERLLICGIDNHAAQNPETKKPLSHSYGIHQILRLLTHIPNISIV